MSKAKNIPEIIPPFDTEAAHFDYYMLAATPVRITTSGRARVPLAADALDHRTRTLVRRPELISRVFRSDDSEPTDYSHFVMRCQKIIGEKKSEITPGTVNILG